MDTATVTVFLSVLTIAANVGTVAVVVLAAAGRRDLVGESWRPALGVAGLVTLVATLGSLYYSEIARFQPCQLCWYQRIAMYPLPILLGIATWRADRGVRRYALPIAVIGAVIALYHYQLEWFPQQQELACAIGVPCSVPWFREFGFISLPYMALSGFLFVIAVLLVVAPRSAPGEHDEPPVDQRSHPASDRTSP